MVIDMNYWSKVARKLFILILTIIGLYLGFKLAVFYIPFLIAFILYLLIEPCIRFLMKKFKLRRRTSAIIVFSVVILIVTGITAWGIVTLVQEASNLLGGLNGYFEKGNMLLNSFTEYFKTSKIQIPDEVQNILQNSGNEFLNEISVWTKEVLTKFLNALTSLPTIGFYIVICVLALYFICTDKIYMIDQLEHHLPETWVKRLVKHIKEIAKALGCYLKAESILILGTSDDMVQKIVRNLGLPEIEETIYIEDVSSPEEIAAARSARMSGGKHVIPVPTFELKKDFSGFLLDPLQIFKWKGRNSEPVLIEKSLIRPTFSYLGRF